MPIATPNFRQLAIDAMRRNALYAGILSFFVNLLMLTGPIYMLQVYDRVLASRSHETLFFLTVLIFFLFLSMAIIDFSRNAILARAGADLEETFAQTIFTDNLVETNNIQKKDQSLIDLKILRRFVGSPAVSALFDAPWTPFFLFLIFMMHWVLGVVALTGLLLLVALSACSEYLSRGNTLFARQRDTEADQLQRAAFRNAAVTRSLGMTGAIKARWSDTRTAASNLELNASDTTGSMASLIKSLRLFIQSLLLGTGAYLAINGEVSPGVMIAASIIAGRAFAPVEVIASSWGRYQLARSAYARLTNHFATRKNPKKNVELPALKGKVDVSRISFIPEAGKEPVLKNISFSISPGQVLGVFGASAAGKTTLARCVLGLDTVVTGDIRLDGAKLDQWEPDRLGRYLGYLPQDVELFQGTVVENIARFQSDATTDEVIRAAKAADAHELILTLPNGYNTQLGDGAQHVSAGQRQRIGLARALFRNPTFVVLDEPNSNLDTSGEQALGNAIKKLKDNGVSTMIIAHRPATLAYVDTLLVLANGVVQMYGPRDEVIKRTSPENSASVLEMLKRNTRESLGQKSNNAK